MRNFMHRLSVIVPTRNRAKTVFELICYLQGTLAWTCPLIIVDQSDDGGKALARLLSSAADLDVLHIPDTGRGTSRARNVGFAQASTEWVLFLDDDVRPIRDYLPRMERFIEEHSWADVIQGATEQKEGWADYCTGTYPLSQDVPLIGQRLIPGTDRDAVEWFGISPYAKYEAAVVGIGSGNFAIRSWCYEGIGGFDERIEGRGEDAEFGVRLWWYGYRSIHCPGALVFHLREETGGTREMPSWTKRLFAPEPAPGWLYFYMKWFPGTPFRSMVANYIARWSRRPWTLPVKAIRMTRSIREARRRLIAGGQYIYPPVPRAHAENRLMEAAAPHARVATR